jgi:tryptophan synthase alpha chain
MMANLDRRAIHVPVIAFTYYNPLFVRGPARSARDLARAGFAGAIVPDLPIDEADEAIAAFKEAGIGLAMLVAPTTPVERARSIAALSSDFVYVVSRMGVTGAGESIEGGVRDLVARLRPITDKPLAVGFGISTPDQATAVARFADGVVVGSALVEKIAAAAPGEEEAAAREFCASLAAAVRRSPSMRDA